MITCTWVCWTMMWHHFTNRNLTDEERTWLEDRVCRLPLLLICQVVSSFEPRFLRKIDKTMSSKSTHDLFGYGWPLLDAFKINDESLLDLWVLMNVGRGRGRATVCAGMAREVLGSGFLFSHPNSTQILWYKF